MPAVNFVFVVVFDICGVEVVMDINNITVDPQSERGCDPVKEKVTKLGIQKGILNEDVGIALFYNLTRYR